MNNKPTKKIEREGNHESETVEHPSGRKDVTIRVGTLNVDENTPEGKKAKEKIEKEVIPALANRVVVVTVIHKPTGKFTSAKVKLPRVREWAETVANSLIKGKGGSLSDFFVVEHEGEQVRVTTLEV